MPGTPPTRAKRRIRLLDTAAQNRQQLLSDRNQPPPIVPNHRREFRSLQRLESGSQRGVVHGPTLARGSLPVQVSCVNREARQPDRGPSP
jgi:hypothetical protein